ncbi:MULTISPECIES: RebB family R body protein [Rheinheimera]|uniref:RebB like protein n=1 Tax=Rheinheimera tangshanensis TaxID=400153 RepID=A0A5C8M2T5_9GAMM|nr:MULTISPECIES: RebB family R body protein [Rheinheimera]KOO57343.1 RebB like protein [Rheinheimera sp. KL1]TXK82765.1 RebB like protein [Rheinheimera tangshanensis]GGM49214.1 hypothetical protein GCM10010920_07060 [Rheinheimera tangshanensis]
MSTVNPQITDAVTQTNTTVLCNAPSQAIATLYQLSAHALGLAMHNAVSNQQNLNQLNPAIVAQAIQLLKS